MSRQLMTCYFSPMQKKTDAAELHIIAAYQSPYGQRFEVKTNFQVNQLSNHSTT